MAALLVLVLAAAFGLRLAAGAWWEARLPDEVRFGFGDSEGYWKLGQAIARGEPYQYESPDARVFRAPGYPLLLAGLFQLTGPDPPVAWGRVYSALWATLAVGGVFWLGQQLFDLRAGLVAALLAAVYPGAAALGAFILSEAPFCALLPLQLVLWHKGWKAESRAAFGGWLLAAGLVAGCATLVRPSWLLFTPFALAAGWLLGFDRRRQVAAAPWLLAGLVVVMAPWWVRNAHVTGRFIPTTLQVGASLYDGLHPGATGASDMDFLPEIEARLRAEDASLASLPAEPFEYRLHRHLLGEAAAWALEHPGRAVQLAGVKFLRMWNLWPNEEQFRGPLLRAAVLFSYAPLLVLGLAGAWKFRRSWLMLLCLLPAVYLTLLHMVFTSSIRYREPAMLALIVLASGLLVAIRRRSPPPNGAVQLR